jgi:L-fucose isomerase-like protein
VAAIAFFRQQEVEGIIVGGMDFADEISAATVAAALKKPVLLFATKEGELRADGERVSDSFCGSLSIGVALHRRKTPFVFAGLVWPEEEVFLSRVRAFVGACAAMKGFMGARIGQIGVREPRRFETVATTSPRAWQVGQKIVPSDPASMRPAVCPFRGR